MGMWEAPGSQQSHKLLGKSAPFALAGAVLRKEAQKKILAKHGWNWEWVNSLGDGPQSLLHLPLPSISRSRGQHGQHAWAWAAGTTSL